MSVRTLADYIEEQGGFEAMQLAADPLVNRLFLENGVLYFWCRCRRRVLTDMMSDLENPEVPVPIRVTRSVRFIQTNRRRKEGEDDRRFACDGCWTLWVRMGFIDRDAFRRATGAPPLPPDSRAPW